MKKRFSDPKEMIDTQLQDDVKKLSVHELIDGYADKANILLKSRHMLLDAEELSQFIQELILLEVILRERNSKKQKKTKGKLK